jgi:adenylate cyclase
VHHGRVVKRTGDGAIVEFRSVVDAVRCAIEVQTGLAERNSGLPPEKRIEYRVGIHLGDVVEEADGDLMGDGVNVAARLEGICEPGGICLSEDAYRQVKSRLELKVANLKNIAEPVHAYLLRQGAPGSAKSTKAATKGRRLSYALTAALTTAFFAAGGYVWHAGVGARLLGTSVVDDKLETTPHLSIVVLPFENLSHDTNHDRLADSLTDSLTSDLSRIGKSFVIAHKTAFTFKDQAIDAKAIGRRLGIRYLVEGSVAREQDRTWVNAQLIDAQSGSHLWAERFEEDVADTFELQDRILARLTNALRRELIIAEAEKAVRTRNPDAIDLAMRGRAIMLGPQRPSKEQNDAAIALFEQALKLDPDEPDALAGLASLWQATTFQMVRRLQY